MRELGRWCERQRAVIRNSYERSDRIGARSERGSTFGFRERGVDERPFWREFREGVEGNGHGQKNERGRGKL